jgi:hypothetical protein
MSNAVDAKVEVRPVVHGFPSAPINAVNPLIERIAYWMDESIPIPGTDRKIGFDALIGLVPGLGDLVTLLPAYLMLQEARRLGLPKSEQAIIAGTYAVDLVVGLVPFLGDLFDAGYKANIRCLRRIQRHLARRAGAGR